MNAVTNEPAYCDVEFIAAVKGYGVHASGIVNMHHDMYNLTNETKLSEYVIGILKLFQYKLYF